MTEEQRKRKLEKNREYKARKRAEKKAAALDLQMPQVKVEVAPESAMGQSLHKVETSELDRAISHEDFVRMSKRNR
jgi:hypothetical protein